MIHTFTYCNFQGDQYINETEVLFYSANKLGYNITVLGRDDKDFNTFKRIEEYVKQIDIIAKSNPEALCMFVDATDTFFAQPPGLTAKRFLSLNCDVLFSAEKWFSWQDDKYRGYFHQHITDSPYRYLNAGNIMGKAFAMGLFFQKVLDFFKNPSNVEPLVYKLNDQTAFGTFIAINNSLANKKVQLDSQCKVFYNPTDDWDLVYLHLQKTKNYKQITVNDLVIKPCVIHVSFKQKYNHVYQQFYGSMKNPCKKFRNYFIVFAVLFFLVIILIIIFLNGRK